MAVTQGNGLNRGVADPATYPESAHSDDIRRDIDQTRTEMDRTIDELGERLRPRNLFDEVVANVRGSLFASGGACGTTAGSRLTSEQVSDAAGKVGRSLVEAIRENPVPAALMGAGLAWLLFEDKAERAYRRRRVESNVRGYTGDRYSDPGTHSGSYVDVRTGEPYGHDYGAGYEDVDDDGEPDVSPTSMKDKAAGAASSVKDTLGSAAHAVSSAADKTASGIKSAARTTRHAASTTRRRMRSTGHMVGQYGRTTGESARHYGHVAADKASLGYEASCERFNRALDEKPLAVGVASLAAGLLAGFAIPSTRTEDRTIGRQADRLKDEAKRRGRDAVEQGKEVAAHVADTALGEAEGQGLTPGSLGDKVTRVAKDAMHAAQESAQREGIDPSSLSQKARFVGQAVKDKGKEEFRHAKSGSTGDGRVADLSGTLPSTGAMGLTDSGPDAAIACGVGTVGSSKAGGLSDLGDAPDFEKEAAIKHDIAEGMSASSEGHAKGQTKNKDADKGDSCSC